MCTYLYILCVLVTQSHLILSDPMARLCLRNSLGKNTGVGCHFPSPGDLPNQELNLGLQYCRQILYYLSHQGSSQKEVWVGGGQILLISK